MCLFFSQFEFTCKDQSIMPKISKSDVACHFALLTKDIVITIKSSFMDVQSYCPLFWSWIAKNISSQLMFMAILERWTYLSALRHVALV